MRFPKAAASMTEAQGSHGHWQSDPLFISQRVARACLLHPAVASSLSRIDATWYFTVWTEISSRRAMTSEPAGLVGADRLRLGSRIRDQHQGRPAPSLVHDIGVAMTVLPPVGETRFVETLDGRKLAYVEFGDPSSPLVIHNHGGPSSRLEGRLLANGATSNGFRLVSVDRPGIGRSTPQKYRSYESWANDLLTIADALGYREFGVSGWSEGGPWPLAAAAYLDPARLRHVTSIAGGNYGTFGDMWAAKFMDKIDTVGGHLALHHRFAFHLMYEILGSGCRALPQVLHQDA